MIIAKAMRGPNCTFEGGFDRVMVMAVQIMSLLAPKVSGKWF